MPTHSLFWVGLAIASLAGVAWGVPPRPGSASKAVAAPEFEAAHATGLDAPAAHRAVLPPQAIVLLVDFADEPHAPSSTPERMHDAFFADTSSVRSFYRDSSYGRYAPNGSVTAWLRLPQTLSFYADGRSGIGGTYPRNARRLVEDAVRAADGNIDFSRFDSDGPDGIASSGDDDGCIDALVVVHAGPGAEFGDRNTILSHSWFTENVVRTRDGPLAWSYAMLSETSPLGVRAHEFGHLLGLPDLYDRTCFNTAGGIGDWSLMGSGSWLGDGELPADLDAPSKIELGFVDPIVPMQNAAGLRLRAALDGNPPDVYQIWTHGIIGSEFFVVVNRRPTSQGVDSRLPGSGMLVYHVDRLQAGNDDRTQLRVRLLQADGLAEIENCQSNGDANDPYPGARLHIDATTTPSTRAHDGSDTQIVLSNLSPATGTMRFDLSLENRPLFVLTSTVLRELTGDGDGVAEAGERLQVDATFVNRGLDAGPVTMRWRSEPPDRVTWVQDSAALTGVVKGGEAAASVVLEASTALGNPAALALVATAREDDGRSEQEIGVVAALGDSRGFLACLEARASRFTRDCSDPQAPWQTLALRGNDAWQLEAQAGELAHVYRSARGATYSNNADFVLVSPPFNVAAGSVLELLHGYAMEDLAVGWAWDGGRVEVALDGGPWEGLEPRGGYPRRLFAPGVPYLAEAGVFSGTRDRQWDTFELGDRAGSVQIRFRLVSNSQYTARGWEVFQVEIHAMHTEHPAGGDLAVLAEPNPVRFPTRLAFRIDAARDVRARPAELRIYDVRGHLVRSLSHAALPAQSAAFTWDGMDRDGGKVSAGIYWARLEWGGRIATTKIVAVD